MKKIIQFKSILIMSSCLFVAGQLFAQQQETSNENGMTTKFGIKGGVNFSNLYINDVQKENMKVGVNAGFFVKVPLFRGLSIQPEVLYSNKGAKDSYGGPGSILGSGEYRFNLNYIETPLLLVFNLTRNLNVSAGGYAAYLVSANVKDMNNDGTITGVTNLNADNFHRFDYGLAGGVGIDIQKVALGARYNYGLQNIGQSGSLSGNLTSNSKNSVLTFFIGFAL
ncbi:MAG TPA: porin family protein [Cyclobacteriaceae bacterium]|jgi:hypothetical protein|nr:porin family protein [Cyclobacteriaceae bacterium]